MTENDRVSRRRAAPWLQGCSDRSAKRAANARTESIAAADASIAQERRATRPRASPAQERSSQSAECCRSRSGDYCPWTFPGENQTQDGICLVVNGRRDGQSYNLYPG